MDDYPYLRKIESPVTAAQLRPLSPQCINVQFAEPLTPTDHGKVAKFLLRYPRVSLRIYGHHGQKCDLSFLHHYPRLRNLKVDVFGLKDLDGLQFASPDLEILALGQTKGKAHSLSFLQRFPRLHTLYVNGHAKDIDVISSLSHLEQLTLSSITLPDLSLLLPLKRLHSLNINLGGTKDFSLLPKIGQLQYLELWMILGLSDLTPIGAVRSLQYLFLRALKQVKELPSLSRLRSLRRVHLETMKSLIDLRPVAKAPALEDLVVLDMKQLQPESFQPFVNHPTLRRASVNLGSQRKNDAIAALLGLPAVEDDFTFTRATGIS